MSDLAAALMVAIRVHAGQRDKQGEPYLLHVLRVVETVSDEAKVVAALHDAFEDSDLTLGDLPFPIKLTEWRALQLLTRQYGAEYGSYIDEIAAGHDTMPETRRIAREVKLADLRDNLNRIPRKADGGEQYAWGASLRRRYEKAIATLEAVSCSQCIEEGT